MIELICTIISGVFAVISAIFSGITIHCSKKINKQKISSGNNSNNIQVGELNNGERSTKD